MSKDANKQIGRIHCVADVEGPWTDPDFESSLIERCRKNWATPVEQLSNAIFAMFLRQGVGLPVVAPEAYRRVESGISDCMELYDGQLGEALAESGGRPGRSGLQIDPLPWA